MYLISCFIDCSYAIMKICSIISFFIQVLFTVIYLLVFKDLSTYEYIVNTRENYGTKIVDKESHSKNIVEDDLRESVSFF